MTEKNLTAAQMLFDARTKGRRKREINTISKLLCIREEYLIALEKGKYDVIPEVVYVLGFARNYAMELGLDPDEIVQKIKQEMGLISECDLTPKADTEPEPRSTTAASVTRQTSNNMALKKTSKYIYKHWKWLLAIVVALVILILGFSMVLSLGGDQDAPSANEEIIVVVKEPEYKQSIREKFGTENSATARVILQATAESWVKIEDARGNTVFSRVLVPGDVYYVPDEEKYKATFGNAGGVDVWVNGIMAPKQGGMGARKSGISMNPDVLLGTEDQVVPE